MINLQKFFPSEILAHESCSTTYFLFQFSCNHRLVRFLVPKIAKSPWIPPFDAQAIILLDDRCTIPFSFLNPCGVLSSILVSPTSPIDDFAVIQINRQSASWLSSDSCWLENYCFIFSRGLIIEEYYGLIIEIIISQ